MPLLEDLFNIKSLVDDSPQRFHCTTRISWHGLVVRSLGLEIRISDCLGGVELEIGALLLETVVGTGDKLIF